MNWIHNKFNLAEIACVSPRIYKTITRTLKSLLRGLQPYLRPVEKHQPRKQNLNRVSSVLSSISQPSNYPSAASSEPSGFLDDGKPSAQPKSKNYLWALVKTPQQYYEELSKEDELALKQFLSS